MNKTMGWHVFLPISTRSHVITVLSINEKISIADPEALSTND